MRERLSHPERSRATAPTHPVGDPRSERLDRLVATLERGIGEILDSDGFAAYLRMRARFHRYSFANTLLIMTQRPDATLVNTYPRWQALGRQVRTGETAIKIFYPRQRKIEEELPDEEGSTDRYVLSGFGIGNVFDISQTDGETLPAPPPVREREESDATARAINRRLASYLIDQGLRLESRPLHGHAAGYWHPAANTIVVRRTEGVDPLTIQKTKTLVHEAAHWQADHRGAIDRGDAETVAESCAYVVLQPGADEPGSEASECAGRRALAPRRGCTGHAGDLGGRWIVGGNDLAIAGAG